MARVNKKKHVLAERAVAAFRGGDFVLAEHLFTKAVAADRRNAALRVDLGLTNEKLGYMDDAARLYCEALAIKAHNPEAARCLSSLVHRYEIEAPGELNRSGLTAASYHGRFCAGHSPGICLTNGGAKIGRSTWPLMRR